MNTEELFLIKQKFLKEIPHPRIIKKYIDRLGGGEVEQAVSPSADLPLSAALDIYLEELMKSKLQIANSQDDKQLQQALKVLYSEHLVLLQKMANYWDSDEFVIPEDIKLSQPIDAYAISKFIRDNNIGETEIKRYLRDQFEAGERSNFLYQNVAQAFRLTEDG